MVNYGIKYGFCCFLYPPFSVEPVLMSQTVQSGHSAIPHEWPLNNSLIVVRGWGGGRGDRVGKLEQTNLHQLKCVGGGGWMLKFWIVELIKTLLLSHCLTSHVYILPFSSIWPKNDHNWKCRALRHLSVCMVHRNSNSCFGNRLVFISFLKPVIEDDWL